MVPKVSIIVPCYNVEKYVGQCLDSLLKQTLTDIEIICIDDKSTDGTLSILKKYAKQDARIVVKSLACNSGVSVARNTGIKKAAGEYIAFVDSDDCVDCDFYERLYNAAIATNSDIARGELKSIDIHGNTDFALLNQSIMSNKYNFSCCFTTAIYRTTMIKQNGLVFPLAISMGEDIFFLLTAVHAANHVATVDCTFYNYIRRDFSLDSETFSSQKIDGALSGIQKLVNWLNSLENINADNYYIIMKRIIGTITYLLSKKIVRSDYRAISDCIIWCYNNTKCPEIFIHTWGWRVHKYIKNSDAESLARYFATRTTWTWLFGAIPLYKITRFNNQEFKFYIFGILPILTIRRTHKTEYRVFGVLMLKVK